MVSGHGWNRAKIIQTTAKPLALAMGSVNNKQWEDWSELMIKITNIKVFNAEGAIRGMRNPMNSWDKSDSVDGHIGDNDFALMKRLFDAGTEHRKYLRQIFVACDILAPLYWWKEFDTYKVGTTANSCSTMHKIHEKRFSLDDFSTDHLLGAGKSTLEDVICDLNYFRESYLEDKNKLCWWQLIQLLPSSYNQLRTVTMNYEVLANIIRQRKNHKLDEWIVFCEIMLIENPILRRLMGDVKIGNGEVL